MVAKQVIGGVEVGGKKLEALLKALDAVKAGDLLQIYLGCINLPSLHWELDRKPALKQEVVTCRLIAINRYHYKNYYTMAIETDQAQDTKVVFDLIHSQEMNREVFTVTELDVTNSLRGTRFI